jgi:hypothetical protein
MSVDTYIASLSFTSNKTSSMSSTLLCLVLLHESLLRYSNTIDRLTVCSTYNPRHLLLKNAFIGLCRTSHVIMNRTRNRIDFLYKLWTNLDRQNIDVHKSKIIGKGRMLMRRMRISHDYIMFISIDNRRRIGKHRIEKFSFVVRLFIIDIGIVLL